MRSLRVSTKKYMAKVSTKLRSFAFKEKMWRSSLKHYLRKRKKQKHHVFQQKLIIAATYTQHTKCKDITLPCTLVDYERRCSGYQTVLPLETKVATAEQRPRPHICRFVIHAITRHKISWYILFGNAYSFANACSSKPCEDDLWINQTAYSHVLSHVLSFATDFCYLAASLLL